MLPETEEQRIAREARLKNLCDQLGLNVTGSMVTVPGFPNMPPIDASVIDLTRGPQCLMYLAFKAGIEANSESRDASLAA